MKNALVILLLLLPLRFSFAQETKCSSAFKNELTQSLVSLSKRNLNNRVYSIGESEGRLVVLSKKEYQKWYREDRFEPQDILVLEAIDPKLDLPFVSGIIVSKKLPAGKSHLDEMAQKLRIPFLYQSKAYEKISSSYSNDKKETVSFSIKENRSFKLKLAHKEAQVPDPITSSVLPFAIPENSPLRLYSYQEALKQPVEKIGEKFKWLAAFKVYSKEDNASPEISSISSSLYSLMMNQKLDTGQSLKAWYLMELQKLSAPKEYKNLLSKMRHLIVELQNKPSHELEHGLREIWEQIQSKYSQFSRETVFSLRSNSAVEDIIAAGLYNSARFTLGNFTEFKNSLFNVWLSSFDTRAFYTRRYFGLIEANHSMPVLVHPFEGKQIAHAIIDMSPSLKGGYKFEANLVRGSNEVATNPSNEALTSKQQWQWHRGKLEATSSKDNSFLAQERGVFEKLSKELTQTIAQLKSLEASLQDIWSFEVVIQKTQEGELNYKILQVKNRVSFDQSLQILKGELPRDSFQKLDLNTQGFKNIQDYVTNAIESVQLVSLKNYFKSLKTENPELKGVLVDNFRFVLVEIGGEKMIITNKNSNAYMHYTIVSNLQSRIPHFPIKVLYAGDMSVRVIPKVGSFIKTSPARAVPYEAIDGLKHKWLPSIELKPLIRKSIKEARTED